MKKVLKFLALVLLVAVVAFAVSVFISRRSEDGTDSVILDRFDQVQEYRTADNRPTKITADEGSFPFILPNSTELRYYHPRSGEIKKIDLVKNGRAELIATIKPLATYLSWSPDGSEILAHYGSTATLINLKSGTSKTLDKNISQPVFSNTTADVAYLFFNTATGEGNISVADSTFTTFKNLLKTRLKNWNIQWNGERRLSLIATAADTKMESLFLLDTEKKNLVKILDSQRNLSTLWSPDGSTLLFGRTSRTGNGLYLLSLSENTTSDVKLTGVASKCAWSDDGAALYCASPDTSATSPTPSPTASEDAIYRITMATSKIEKILDTSEAGFVDVRDMRYVHALPGLIFKNFKDGRLYMLRISE